MRPVLMLFIGTRGVRIADTCNPLAAFADVVLAVSDDVLAERADSLDASTRYTAVVRVPHRDDLVAAALRYARRNRVDGALTFSDDMLLDTARFADGADVPGQPVATVDAFRDKYLQRQTLVAGGLRVPRYAEITDPARAGTALDTVGLPAILKPTRGSGSALAFPVTTPAELADRLRESFESAPLVGGAVAADTAFILEELLIGDPSWHAVPGFAPYVSVETVAVDGEYRHLGVTDRFPLAPPVLETGMMFPSGLAPEQTAQVVAVAEKALGALSFRHGLAHVELMLTAGGPSSSRSTRGRAAPCRTWCRWPPGWTWCRSPAVPLSGGSRTPTSSPGAAPCSSHRSTPSAWRWSASTVCRRSTTCRVSGR
nr:hypothetical protein [uncultured bacterium]